MIETLYKCSPAGNDGTNSGGMSIKHDDRTHIIDIHCHLGIPAADELMRPYMENAPSINQFSSPATGEVNRKLFQSIGKKLTVIDERLSEMDKLGIDIQVISPSPGQYYYFAEPDLGLQAAKLVNNGITEAVAKYPDRFIGMGSVPLQNTDMAIIEMKRCVKELGLSGIEISTNVGERELSHPDIRPFFAAAEELGVLIFIHPLGFSHGQRLKEHYFNNLIGNPLESTIAVSHLIFDGVLDQYPGLKVCVAHGGGYLPVYHGRMDHGWRVREDCRQTISKTPSEYLHQLYFDTLVFDKDHLSYMVKIYGADHLCLGTDYPFDMSETDPIGFHDQLSDNDRKKIFGETAAYLLGLKLKN